MQKVKVKHRMGGREEMMDEKFAAILASLGRVTIVPEQKPDPEPAKKPRAKYAPTEGK